MVDELTVVSSLALLVVFPAVEAATKEVLVNPCYEYEETATADGVKLFVFTADECYAFCRIRRESGDGCEGWELTVETGGKAHEQPLLCTLFKSKPETPKPSAEWNQPVCEKWNALEEACVLLDYKRSEGLPVQDEAEFQVESHPQCLQKCRENHVEKKGCNFYTFAPTAADGAGVAGGGTCKLLKAGKIEKAPGHVTGRAKCDECKDVGMDIVGNDVAGKIKVVDSFDDCWYHCLDTPGCNAFTFMLIGFAGTPSGNCYPKTKAGAKKPNAKVISGSSECLRDPFNPWLDLGVFYAGEDLRHLKALSTTHCRELCQADKDCNSYSFQVSDVKEEDRKGEGAPKSFEKKTCWLKTAKGKQISRKGFSNSFFSGDKYCRRQGIFVQNQSTFRGIGVKAFADSEQTESPYPVADLEGCQAECDKYPDCNSFTYSENGDKCEMIAEGPMDAAKDPLTSLGFTAYDSKAWPRDVALPCELMQGAKPTTGYRIVVNITLLKCWTICQSEDACGSFNYDPTDGTCSLAADRWGIRIRSWLVVSGNKCG